MSRGDVVGMTCVLLSGLLAGCGGSASGPAGRPTNAFVSVTAPHQVPIGAPTKRQSAPTKAVLTQVNVVCNAVLHGWPRPLTRPYTAAKLSRYAAAAALLMRRAVVSLERLEQLGDASTLASLAAAWRQLQALYGSGEVVGHHRTEAASLGRQIVMHQQAVTALADADRFPACRVSLGR